MNTQHCAFVLLTASLFVCQAQAAGSLADRHTKLGIPCEMCHGPDKKQPAEPTIETCAQCHPIAELTAKTRNVKPKNPHVSPHYQDQLDCTNCHRGHEAGENFCNQCHNFCFKVP